MLYVLAFSAIVCLIYAQQTCIYTHSDTGYTLNLTEISEITLELETPYDRSFYYTPCSNRVSCIQGNAKYSANVAEYQPRANTCTYYLSVDEHNQPEYGFNAGSWRFRYGDGEMCEQTTSPRSVIVYYNCDEEQKGSAYFYSIQETETCKYEINIHSPLACVPASQYNAKCQYKIKNSTGHTTHSVDLSPLKGAVIHASTTNNYEFYLSPCTNILYCNGKYPYPVMSMIDNSLTNTCEHYLAIWEDGRVLPLYHDSEIVTEQHWSFHYFNGQRCTNKVSGEEIIRYFCDPNVSSYKVINATGDGDCNFEMNIATRYACDATKEIYFKAKLI